MSKEDRFINVFLDLLPNQPKNDQARENARRTLHERFEATLPQAVERLWDLPPLIVKEPFGDYLDLLLEARALFVAGHFYACVAMCGIVAERLEKDVLRACVMVDKDGSVQKPKDAALDQFERVEVSGIVRFLKEADLLSADATKAAIELVELRNAYAHARGKGTETDASKAIVCLHKLVEDTVSVFKHYDIKDGAFVRKPAPPKAQDG